MIGEQIAPCIHQRGLATQNGHSLIARVYVMSIVRTTRGFDLLHQASDAKSCFRAAIVVLHPATTVWAVGELDVFSSRHVHGRNRCWVVVA